MQPLRKTKQDIGARRLLAEEEVKLATLKKEPGGAEHKPQKLGPVAPCWVGITHQRRCTLGASTGANGKALRRSPAWRSAQTL
jgi:hypothetical protein